MRTIIEESLEDDDETTITQEEEGRCLDCAPSVVHFLKRVFGVSKNAKEKGQCLLNDSFNC